MKKAIVLAALCVIAIAGDADAGTCQITDLPLTGTITSERLNVRIQQTENCINGKIGNVNWAASEPLALTNLQNQRAMYSQSWTIADEDGDAVAGEDVSVGNNVRNWRVPVASIVTGVSVALRCPSDVTGTPADCAAASVTVALQRGTTTIKTFAGIATNTVQTDMGLGSSVSTSEDLNIDISGTMTDVDFIDVVVYTKALHQI